MVELKVRLGSKGQVVIPKIFRDSYKMYPNQEVIILPKEEGVVIAKSKADPIRVLEMIAKIASEKRKGKTLRYNKSEFYEQYDKRAERAGIKI